MTTFSTEYLVALTENFGEPPLVRNLAKCALNQRLSLSSNKAGRVVDRVERQVRDLSAENARLRRRIAELESITA